MKTIETFDIELWKSWFNYFLLSINQFSGKANTETTFLAKSVWFPALFLESYQLCFFVDQPLKIPFPDGVSRLLNMKVHFSTGQTKEKM